MKRFKPFFGNIKSMFIGSSYSIHRISPASKAYNYFNSEYRHSSFSRISDRSYLIPEARMLRSGPIKEKVR